MSNIALKCLFSETFDQFIQLNGMKLNIEFEFFRIFLDGSSNSSSDVRGVWVVWWDSWWILSFYMDLFFIWGEFVIFFKGCDFLKGWHEWDNFFPRWLNLFQVAKLFWDDRMFSRWLNFSEEIQLYNKTKLNKNPKNSTNKSKFPSKFHSNLSIHI